MVVGPRLSEGIATPVMPRQPAKPPKLSYDSPRVSTTNGRTGQSTPYAGTNPTPITAPSYNPAPAYQAPYVPPYQAPYVPPYQPAPMNFPAQTFQNFEPPAPPPPPPPPKPPVGGREWYQALSEAARKQQDEKWLGGDADFQGQISEYDKALDAFVDRIAKQKKLFGIDEQEGLANNTRNMGVSLNNLGEDFGARGLSYSGLFDQTKQESKGRFDETGANIRKNKTRLDTDATNREADYRGENQVGRGNARRAALQRMAAEQALKDANAGF